MKDINNAWMGSKDIRSKAVGGHSRVLQMSASLWIVSTGMQMATLILWELLFWEKKITNLAAVHNMGQSLRRTLRSVRAGKMSRSVNDQRRMLVHPMPTAYGSGSSLITFRLLVPLETDENCFYSVAYFKLFVC